MFALSPEYMNISGPFSVDGAIRIGAALSEDKQTNTSLVVCPYAAFKTVFIVASAGTSYNHSCL